MSNRRVCILSFMLVIMILTCSCGGNNQSNSSDITSQNSDSNDESSSWTITPPSEYSTPEIENIEGSNQEDYDGFIEDYNTVTEESVRYLLTALYPKALEVEDKLFGNGLVGKDFYSNNVPITSSPDGTSSPVDDELTDLGNGSTNIDDNREIPEHWIDISHLAKFDELKDMYSTTYTKYCIFSNNPFGEGEATKARFRKSSTNGLEIDYFYSPKINFSTIDINTSKIVYQETGKKVIVTVDAFNSIDKTPLGPKTLELVYEDDAWKFNHLIY